MYRSSRAVVSALLILMGLLAPVVHAQAGAPVRVYLPLVFQSFDTEINLVSVADATIYQGAPDANRGTDGYLIAGNDQPVENQLGIYRSLIWFDLTPVATRTVQRAILRIYYGGYWDYPDHPRTIHVERIGQPWTETAVTWGNQPPPLKGEYGSVSIPGNTSYGYREIDVTDLVTAWLDGTAANYGLYLIGPEASGSDASYRIFLSREVAGSDHPYPPELVIKF